MCIAKTTYVSSDNDVIIINDQANDATTVGYYILENSYNSGTVTYSFDVNLGGIGSKWNFARFLDKTGKEVLAIRMAENTKYVPILSNTLKSWIAVSLLNLNNTLIS